ncbi:unnamed protein product [Lactuca saligna]|uniref:Uncharacterized protein n=1 Tax=Lactuca saligna TaxID=75948 RepID=A0AA36EKK3_LACSI|nr:unnamed protein product [Lactuca saligna]
MVLKKKFTTFYLAAETLQILHVVIVLGELDDFFNQKYILAIEKSLSYKLEEACSAMPLFKTSSGILIQEAPPVSIPLHWLNARDRLRAMVARDEFRRSRNMVATIVQIS